MVYFLENVLQAIDLNPIMSVYEKSEKGYPPYHPKMLIGVLFYGYTHGVFSSRKLARHCQESIPFRVMAANNTPDHRTISDFRKRHLAALEHIFLEILRLCREAGLVKFGHVSVDGTKVKANASQHKAMSYGRMKEDIVRLEKEIHTLIREAERADAQDDRTYGKDKRGDELPAELARRESRLGKSKKPSGLLKNKSIKRRISRRPMHQHSLKQRSKRKQILSPGNNVQPIKRSATSPIPDSRIMPAPGKTFIQGCHSSSRRRQRAPDYLIATYVTNCPNDQHVLPYLLTRLPGTPKVLTGRCRIPC